MTTGRQWGVKMGERAGRDIGEGGKECWAGGRRKGGGSFCVKRLGADTQGKEVTKVACTPFPLLAIS